MEVCTRTKSELECKTHWRSSGRERSHLKMRRFCGMFGAKVSLNVTQTATAQAVETLVVHTLSSQPAAGTRLWPSEPFACTYSHLSEYLGQHPRSGLPSQAAQPQPCALPMRPRCCLHTASHTSRCLGGFSPIICYPNNVRSPGFPAVVKQWRVVVYI